MIDNFLANLTNDEKFFSILLDTVKERYITEPLNIINFKIDYAHGFESGFVARLCTNGSVDRFEHHVEHCKKDDLHGTKAFSLSAREGEKFRIKFFYRNSIQDLYYRVVQGKLIQYA